MPSDIVVILDETRRVAFEVDHVTRLGPIRRRDGAVFTYLKINTWTVSVTVNGSVMTNIETPILNNESIVDELSTERLRRTVLRL